MGNWYKNIKTAAGFGQDPFGQGELTDKVRVSPFGNLGGDEKTGVFEPSSGKHHPNDYFSEHKEPGLIEKKLREKLKKLRKIKNKKKLQLNNFNKKTNSSNRINIIEGQWGSQGPKMPTWNNGGSNWMTDTYHDIIGDKPQPQPQPQQQQPVRDRKSSAEYALAATVTIKASSNQAEEIGSGFFIGPNTILTCAHVVSPVIDTPGSKMMIRSKQNEYNGHVWTYDYALDIAVVFIESKDFKFENFLKLGNSSQTAPGEDILIIGTPLGFENVVGQGIISSAPIAYTEGQEQKDYIFVSANIAPGNSGGPVLTTSNNSVIGIAAAVISTEETGNNGLNAAIPVDSIKPFLKQNGIKFEFVQ